MLRQTIQFNRQNSRVSFGTFMFEAARQGDWQSLQLILDQEGGGCTAFPLITSSHTICNT